MATHDLLFVIDATSSMQNYLRGVQACLKQLAYMSVITGFLDKVGILLYRDYDCDKVVEFSGWDNAGEIDLLSRFIKGIKAQGGGDPPEAVKYALNYACQISNKKTIAVLYTDSPPHHVSMPSSIEHLRLERTYLGMGNSDWVKICKKAQQASLQFFCVLPDAEMKSLCCWYVLLSHLTGGATISLELETFLSRDWQGKIYQRYKLSEQDIEDTICKHTIGLYLSWMGYEHDFEKCKMLQFPSNNELPTRITCEADAHNVLPSMQQGSATGRWGPEVARAMEDTLLPIQPKPPSLPLIAQLDVVKHFRHDSTYQDLVFTMFDVILQPSYLPCLIYNTLFGKLWRCICTMREDKRRERLVAKMGNAISGLNIKYKKELKQYLEASYDQSEYIQEVSSKTTKYPALIVESNIKLSRPQLMEISRSCAPSVIKNVSTMLTGLRIVHGGPLPRSHIPLSLPDKLLFALLPHLACHGTVFSLRPAALLAIISATSKNILSDRAQAYLEQIKGSWIDQSLPENVSLSLFKLLLRVPSALTPQELKLYAWSLKVSYLKMNENTSLSIDTGFTSSKTTRPDYKIKCKCCSKQRSFTLVTEDGRCGLCVLGKHADEPKDGDRSVWCECSKCTAHYAVIRPELLCATPKCHGCRENTSAFKVACCLCKNLFVDQTKTFAHASEVWVCPPCHHNSKALLQTSTANFKEYQLMNDLGFLGIHIKDSTKFWSNQSIINCLSSAQEVDSQPPRDHKLGKKAVLNIDEVMEQFQGWLNRGESEKGCCCLCYDEVDKRKLHKFCNRRKCEAVSCHSCMQHWYGQLQPGKLFLPPNAFCAFCKNKPDPKILRKFNPRLNSLDVSSFDSSNYYAWCSNCDEVKPAVEKACTEDVPQYTNFICSECTDHKSDIIVKNCPFCTVSIVRSGGCAHIECSNCYNHFCWICLKKSSYSEIYKHISSQHGGYGFDEDDQDFYDDESDDGW